MHSAKGVERFFYDRRDEPIETGLIMAFIMAFNPFTLDPQIGAWLLYVNEGGEGQLLDLRHFDEESGTFR